MPGYPNESDFTTGGADDAYWYVRLPDGTHRCSTNGLAFVMYLQTILGVTSDGRWGPHTGAALVSALQTAGADNIIVQGVQGETTLRRVGRVSLTTAIWVIQNYQAFGSVPSTIALNQIELPAQTTPPTWDVAAPGDPYGQLTCIAESTSSDSQPTPSAPSVPTTNTANDTGGNAPSVPSGVRSLIYQGGSSISWVLVALLAVGLGVAYWLTSDMTRRSTVTRRRNPRRRHHGARHVHGARRWL